MAPKAQALVEAAVAADEKCLIFASRGGCRVVAKLLEKQGVKLCGQDSIGEFNDPLNADGSLIKACVLHAASCAEGLSFFAVRRVFFLEIPQSWSQFTQLCGRAVRLGSHASLPPESRRVRFHMFLARPPKGSRAKTEDQLQLARLKGQAAGLWPALQQLRAAALRAPDGSGPAATADAVAPSGTAAGAQQVATKSKTAQEAAETSKQPRRQARQPAAKPSKQPRREAPELAAKPSKRPRTQAPQPMPQPHATADEPAAVTHGIQLPAGNPAKRSTNWEVS